MSGTDRERGRTRLVRRAGVVTLLAAAGLPGSGATAQQQEVPPSPEALRQAAHGMALARMGRSGLRSLLSASGNLGDLRNRAGSYETAMQLERARKGPLRGRIAALEDALRDPGLPATDRAALEGLRSAALDELARVPRYEAAYRTATAQAETLEPAGFVGSRPLFFSLRARGHARWGGEDELTVFSEAVSAGPVMVTDRWIVSPGLSLGRTDVSIGHFDGNSGTTSIAAVLSVGRLLGDEWSAAVQLAHGLSWSGSAIVRPGPDGPTRVRSDGSSRTISAKAEVKGRLALAEPGGVALRLRPRIGAFLTSTRGGDGGSPDGEAGPSGERETVAALRVGAAFEAEAGRWDPSVYLGWEQELTDDLNVLIEDLSAVLVTLGLSRSWGRGRRVSLDYSFLRGLKGLRRVSELTLVLILDG